MVVKKKTVKVEAVDLEEEKLQMLIGNMSDMSLQTNVFFIYLVYFAIVFNHSTLKFLRSCRFYLLI